jgi:release factor glutamine methyltransferase
VNNAPPADAARRLAAAGIDNSRLDVRLLLAHAGGDNILFESLMARRVAREPLAYILGEKEFWSLPLAVGPGVLIPRPETETIVEQALDFFPDRSAPLRIFDFGTGSGCLLIALLKEFPNSNGHGLDLSEQARAFAVRNLVHHDLTARAEIRAGNWSHADAGPYDIIVSNPPYVRSAEVPELQPDVARYEPVLALDGGPDGLAAYRLLVPELMRLLRPSALAFLEIGAGQAQDVTALMAQAGLETLRVAPDLAGIPRVVVLGQKDHAQPNP